MNDDCARFRDVIERRLAEPLSAEAQFDLEEHCRSCADCAALDAADAELTALASDLEPTDAELLEIRRGVLRQARLSAAAPRQRRRWAWWQPALAALAALGLVGAGVLLGRERESPAAADKDPVLRELRRVALASTGSRDPLESPFTYSNVRVEPTHAGRLRLEFDVSTHLALERPANDPLVAEVVAQTLLTGASPVGGRLEAVAAADHLLDPRVRAALLRALGEDPDAVVRLKAFAELTRRRGDPDVEKAALGVLEQESSVQIRLAAIDYLTGNGVDRAALQRALDASDPATRGPLMVRAAQYLHRN